MAYIDDVYAQRRQWALEDANQDIQTHQDSAQQSSGTTAPATRTVRSQAGWFVAIGLPCLIPPATPIGIFLVIVGVGLFLFSPAMAKAETTAHQTTVDQVNQGSGKGCGAVVAACLVATVIVLGVVGVAVLAAEGIR